uniref:arginase family protein n=1 Tax=Cryptosporangium minutisporangium TaxID=113569 RepID=UPI003671B3A4
MFPGATAEREDANFVVVGAPLDVSTTFQPGTRFGPRRVRTFAETFDDYDHRTDS